MAMNDKELIAALAECLDEVLLAAVTDRLLGSLADKALELIDEAKLRSMEVEGGGMNNLKEIDVKLKEIAGKRLEAAGLHAQLEKSLAIEEAWPGVFSFGGKVSAQWVGSRFKDARLTIKLTRADGAFIEQHYTYNELPRGLQGTLPTQLRMERDEFERKQAVMARLGGKV